MDGSQHTTTPAITPEWADRYVAGWMAAWNSHDVDAVVSHYAPDVEYRSPFVAAWADPSGCLSGRAALVPYVARAFETYPDLHFAPPLVVAAGVGSVTFHYLSVGGRHAVETLVFAPDGLVARAHCHYR